MRLVPVQEKPEYHVKCKNCHAVMSTHGSRKEADEWVDGHESLCDECVDVEEVKP